MLLVQADSKGSTGDQEGKAEESNKKDTAKQHASDQNTKMETNVKQKGQSKQKGKSQQEQEQKQTALAQQKMVFGPQLSSKVILTRIYEFILLVD